MRSVSRNRRDRTSGSVVRTVGVQTYLNKVHQLLSIFLKHVTLSVSECLPRPLKVNPKDICFIYVIFAIVWILMILEAYGLRMRRVIASFYYRKVA